MRVAVRTLALVLTVAASVSARAVEPARGEGRPKTALVLSGGGARGAAHVGVLEVMEELRIPVDWVIGTSMGSIVGGLYASGVAPETMRKRFVEVDWMNAFDDNPPRKQLSFRRKEDDDLPLWKLEFGIGPHGFGLPAGLVAGQKLNFILRSMLLHAARPGSFDDLAIPFRAIAVNLESGEAEALDHGDLAKAIRASMAYPVLFTPVEIDGRLYIDGGSHKNLPVDVAQALGAERIIAVDISSPLGDSKEGLSAFGVMLRTISVMSEENLRAQRELIRAEDLLITPELGDVAFDSFDAVGKAIDLGAEAGRAAADRLREFSVSEAEYATFLSRHRRGTQMEEIVIDDVEVLGVKQVSPKLVARRVHTKPGMPLDLKLLGEDLLRVQQIGQFEQVEFHLEEQDGRTKLIIEAEERTWGPWFLRVGAGLQADFAGSGDFTLVGLLRRSHLNRLGGEWKSIVTIGNFDAVGTEFYQPLEYRGIWFVAPRASVAKTADQTFFLNDQEIGLSLDRRQVGLDFGARVVNSAEIRVGVLTGTLEADPLPDDLGRLDVDLGGYRVKATLDTLDDANFPHAGNYSEVTFYASRESAGAEDEYERLLATFNHAGTFGRYSLLGSISGGSGMNSDLPYYDFFSLGGFLTLSGLPRNRLWGPEFGLARLIAYRRFFEERRGPFGGRYYLGLSLEAGDVWETDEKLALDTIVPAGAAFVGADTLFGPVYLGWGLAEGGQSSWYFYVGRLFGRQNEVLR